MTNPSGGAPRDEAFRGGSWLRDLHERMMRPAQRLPPEQTELYGVTFYTCLAGLIAYVTYVPLYLAIDAPTIAVANAVVIVLFVVAELQVMRGRVFAGMMIASSCVAGHAWLTATTLGGGAAFQLHVILALELGLLFTYVPLRTRLLYALLFGLAYVGLVFRLADNTPTVALSAEATRGFELLNSTIFVGVTVLIATFYAWTVSKNRQAREAILHRLEDKNETLRIAHANLARARDEAQGASKAKSMFLANMSHELRTPLNAIIGYGELIEEDAADRGDADLSDQVGRICSAGRHLLALINDILDLAKIEAGRMECERTEFEITTLANDVVATIEHLARTHDNVLEIEIDDGIPPLTSDPTKVRQILFNLLSNANKFTKGGTVTLVIARDDRDAPGVRLEVRDTGIGIPTDKLEHIFEEFSQADGSTTRRFGGTGLGLAITRRFTEMLGGTIGVRSEESSGSTFEVWLPTTLPALHLATRSGRPGPSAADAIV